MNKHIFHIASIVILAAMAVIVFPGISRASELSSATESLDASITKFIEAKDESGDKSMSREEEIVYRKKVVNEALALSLKEIESVGKKLDNTKFDKESDREKIKKIILGWLSNEEIYYKEAQERLDFSGDKIDSIKDLAKEVKSHRDESYNKELSKALDFIFSVETGRLANTASERWIKIESDLKKIEKAGLVDEGRFGKEMEESKKMINGAQSLIDSAFNTVKKYYLPSEKPEDDSDKNLETSPPSPKELCEAAIVNLKSSYGEFVKISIAIKKLLHL